MTTASGPPVVIAIVILSARASRRTFVAESVTSASRGRIASVVVRSFVRWPRASGITAQVIAPSIHRVDACAKSTVDERASSSASSSDGLESGLPLASICQRPRRRARPPSACIDANEPLVSRSCRQRRRRWHDAVSLFVRRSEGCCQLQQQRAASWFSSSASGLNGFVVQRCG